MPHPVTAPEPGGLQRILGSPRFRRSRTAALELARRPDALRSLAAAGRAHLEQLDSDAGAAAEEVSVAEAAQSVSVAAGIVDTLAELGGENGLTQHGALDVTRARMVVAALHYFATHHDVIPDHRPYGLADDLAVLRWALGGAPAADDA